ncbi:MAG: hypothetical protein IIC24_03940, partial [Chloroflexi bacterium]|nr:hypothetical protein [Chloroflexota bacterium]
MDKKSLTYSALLLIGLVFVSILLNRGIIQGVHSSGQVTLNTDQNVYPPGGTIVFTGELEFSLNEQVDIKQVSNSIWLVSFMQYDLGHFDHETCRREPIDNPFGPKVLPMDPTPCVRLV